MFRKDHDGNSTGFSAIRTATNIKQYTHQDTETQYVSELNTETQTSFKRFMCFNIKNSVLKINSTVRLDQNTTYTVAQQSKLNANLLGTFSHFRHVTSLPLYRVCQRSDN